MSTTTENLSRDFRSTMERLETAVSERDNLTLTGDDAMIARSRRMMEKRAAEAVERRKVTIRDHNRAGRPVPEPRDAIERTAQELIDLENAITDLREGERSKASQFSRELMAAKVAENAPPQLSIEDRVAALESRLAALDVRPIAVTASGRVAA